MKTSPFAALAVALSLTLMPSFAQAITISTITPTLDFPEPVDEPVSQDKTNLNQ